MSGALYYAPPRSSLRRNPSPSSVLNSVGDTPLPVRVKILANLLVERGITGCAIENAIGHGDNLLLVHGYAVDGVCRILGEEVASCAALVWVTPWDSHTDEQKDCCECGESPEQRFHAVVFSASGQWHTLSNTATAKSLSTPREPLRHS